MGQILHGSAKATPGVKGESKPASARPLARWVLDQNPPPNERQRRPADHQCAALRMQPALSSLREARLWRRASQGLALLKDGQELVPPCRG
jgi:hypothetical protein